MHFSLSVGRKGKNMDTPIQEVFLSHIQEWKYDYVYVPWLDVMGYPTTQEAEKRKTAV